MLSAAASASAQA